MNNINIVNNTKQLPRRSKHLWASWNWFVTAARLCWSPKAADGMGENGKPLSPMALKKTLAIGHQKYVSRKHKNKTKMVMTGDGWGSLVWDHGIRFFSIDSRRPWRDHRMTILTLIRFLAAFFKLLWWRPCQRELQPWRPREPDRNIPGVHRRSSDIMQQYATYSGHTSTCCTFASQMSGVSRKAE